MKKVIGIIGIAILLASCGSTRSYHAQGITPLNKQYGGSCNRQSYEENINNYSDNFVINKLCHFKSKHEVCIWSLLQRRS